MASIQISQRKILFINFPLPFSKSFERILLFLKNSAGQQTSIYWSENLFENGDCYWKLIFCFSVLFLPNNSIHWWRLSSFHILLCARPLFSFLYVLKLGNCISHVYELRCVSSFIIINENITWTSLKEWFFKFKIIWENIKNFCHFKTRLQSNRHFMRVGKKF